jgi:RNA methyltransferase, TrmH family
VTGPGPSSPRTPRLTAARRLVRRSQRDRLDRFLAEGPQAVREALNADTAVHDLFVTATAAARYPELITAAQLDGVPTHVIAESVAADLSETVTPQGIVAVCDSVAVDWPAPDPAAMRLVAVLMQVRDPGNTGTVIRVADAAGADAVVLTAGSVDPHNGKAVRASAGSLFHLPIGTGGDPLAVVEQMRSAGLRVLAADAGGTDLDRLTDAGGLTGPTAWLFGNEAHGLDRAISAAADEVVAVPIHGRAESLNLATAAAVCLYASARAQRAG